MQLTKKVIAPVNVADGVDQLVSLSVFFLRIAMVTNKFSVLRLISWVCSNKDLMGERL
jgi:hypothetical protein